MAPQVLLHGQLEKSLILLNLLNDSCHQVLYSFNKTAWLVFFLLLFFLLLTFQQLLFEAGVYFFLKPTDINDGWIRFTQAIQR